MNKSWVKKLFSVAYVFIAFQPVYINILSLFRTGQVSNVDMSGYNNLLTPIFDNLLNIFNISNSDISYIFSYALCVTAIYFIFNVLATFINYINTLIERWLD